jgi:hypothetical protein
MGSLGPSITVQSNGLAEASKPGYSKGSLGSSITVQYNGYLESTKEGYIIRGVCSPL